jgi:hypothetical protein
MAISGFFLNLKWSVEYCQLRSGSCSYLEIVLISCSGCAWHAVSIWHPYPFWRLYQWRRLAFLHSCRDSGALMKRTKGYKLIVMDALIPDCWNIAHSLLSHQYHDLHSRPFDYLGTGLIDRNNWPTRCNASQQHDSLITILVTVLRHYGIMNALIHSI